MQYGTCGFITDLDPMTGSVNVKLCVQPINIVQ